MTNGDQRDVVRSGPMLDKMVDKGDGIYKLPLSRAHDFLRSVSP